MKRAVIKRLSDGLYFDQGCDCPDRWVSDPLRASNRGMYAMERDAMDPFFEKPGYTLVEFQITATPTGRTSAELFRDGEEIEAWEANQCRQGLHSWVGETGQLDPETVCSREGCSEEYGYPN